LKNRDQIKIYLKDFDFKRTHKRLSNLIVNHRLDLAKKYYKKFVTYADIKKEKDLIIINKHQSVLLKCKDKIVEAIICNIIKENVANHFGIKIKLTIDVYPKINCSKEIYANLGKLIGHDFCADFLNPSSTSLYIYKEKNLDHKVQKIYDQNRDEFRKWLYKYAKYYLP